MSSLKTPLKSRAVLVKLRPQAVNGYGEATQFFHAADEDRHYQMLAVFFVAEFTAELDTQAEHELCWLPIQQARAEFFHESHGWAVNHVAASLRRLATSGNSDVCAQ